MHSQGDTRNTRLDILRIVLLYAAFAALWILFSDEAMRWLFTAPDDLHLSQTLKGLLFVSVTSILLYLQLNKLTSSANSGSLHLRAGAMVGWPRWQLYLFAATITVSTVLVRNDLAPLFDQPTLVIMFMLPIILSAALGGFGPGVIATLLSCLSNAYFAFPSLYSIQIEHTANLLQIGFLGAAGLLVTSA